MSYSPEFENGWSPEYVATIGNQVTRFRCLTIEDKRRLDIYIELMEQFSK